MPDINKKVNAFLTFYREHASTYLSKGTNNTERTDNAPNLVAYNDDVMKNIVTDYNAQQLNDSLDLDLNKIQEELGYLKFMDTYDGVINAGHCCDNNSLTTHWDLLRGADVEAARARFLENERKNPRQPEPADPQLKQAIEQGTKIQVDALIPIDSNKAEVIAFKNRRFETLIERRKNPTETQEHEDPTTGACVIEEFVNGEKATIITNGVGAIALTGEEQALFNLEKNFDDINRYYGKDGQTAKQWMGVDGYEAYITHMNNLWAKLGNNETLTQQEVDQGSQLLNNFNSNLAKKTRVVTVGTATVSLLMPGGFVTKGGRAAQILTQMANGSLKLGTGSFILGTTNSLNAGNDLPTATTEGSKTAVVGVTTGAVTVPAMAIGTLGDAIGYQTAMRFTSAEPVANAVGQAVGGATAGGFTGGVTGATNAIVNGDNAQEIIDETKEGSITGAVGGMILLPISGPLYKNARNIDVLPNFNTTSLTPVGIVRKNGKELNPQFFNVRHPQQSKITIKYITVEGLPEGHIMYGVDKGTDLFIYTIHNYKKDFVSSSPISQEIPIEGIGTELLRETVKNLPQKIKTVSLSPTPNGEGFWTGLGFEWINDGTNKIMTVSVDKLKTNLGLE